jgi:hypothetical protein
VRWYAYAHKGARRECAQSHSKVRSIALVQVCVCAIVGYLGSSYMSELERRPVFGIERMSPGCQ